MADNKHLHIVETEPDQTRLTAKKHFGEMVEALIRHDLYVEHRDKIRKDIVDRIVRADPTQDMERYRLAQLLALVDSFDQFLAGAFTEGCAAAHQLDIIGNEND